jgi:Cu(I)/Ag(I) efflux system membrane fusion protein
MKRERWLVPFAAVLVAGIGGYWLGHKGIDVSDFMTSASSAQTAGHRHSELIIYYRDPDNKPFYSLEPKQTPDGRPYRAVLASEDISFDLSAAKPLVPNQSASRRIFFYRNPMGLPDTSPVPKKDSMGMDYIAVYEDEQQVDSKIVKVSLDKIQRSGVQTEIVDSRVIARPIRAVGTVAHDESRLTIVAMRSDSYIEELFVNKTGEHVHAGDPLFRAYSADIVTVQVDVRNGGSEQRLRNLGVPDCHIREVRAGKFPCHWSGPHPQPET